MSHSDEMKTGKELFRWNGVNTKATVASGIVCGLLLVVLAVSYHLEIANFDTKNGRWVSPNSIPIGSHIRCCVYRGGLWFFNQEVPYKGSVMHIRDERGGILYEGAHHATVKQDWGWMAGGYGLIQMRYIVLVQRETPHGLKS
jgi:hypothetical protein